LPDAWDANGGGVFDVLGRDDFLAGVGRCAVEGVEVLAHDSLVGSDITRRLVVRISSG
jgi:hypothetical protein